MIWEIVFFLGLMLGVITGIILFYTIFYEDMHSVKEFNKRQEHYRKWL